MTSRSRSPSGRARLACLAGVLLGSCGLEVDAPGHWSGSVLSKGQALSFYQTAGPPRRSSIGVRNISPAPASVLVVTIRWSAGHLTTQRLGFGRGFWTDALPEAPASFPLSITVLETAVDPGSVSWLVDRR